jgi:hypothetical protein
MRFLLRLGAFSLLMFSLPILISQKNASADCCARSAAASRSRRSSRKATWDRICMD